MGIARRAVVSARRTDMAARRPGAQLAGLVEAAQA